MMARADLVRKAIDRNRPAILAFLKGLVECNSYVHNKAGVGKVAEQIMGEMPKGFQHERSPNDRFADHHRLSRLSGDGLPIVLAGHMDTLCPPDSPFLHITEQGDKLVGPGVSDMKGGLTVLVWALRVLEECGMLDRMSVVCIFNADEEVGSPTSAAIFTGMKGRASRALVFEAGGPEGTVVTTRKGVARYRLDVEGRAAHFGCLKGEKSSAILEMAHKILAVEALNEPDRSIVANVGKVEGGLAANAVAERASMEFETRHWTVEAEERAARRIEEIAASASVAGCRGKLTRLSGRPPMAPSPDSMALFGLIREVAGALGQTVSEEKRGGVSDANWLAHAGIPTVDGMGPLGDLDFTEKEYILKETLFLRIELTARVLMRLAGLRS